MISPVISLVDEVGQPWQARRDLLSSAALARGFVVETEGRRTDVSALLGMASMAGLRKGPLFARYRIGNGSTGKHRSGLAVAHRIACAGHPAASAIPASAGRQDPEPLDRACATWRLGSFEVAERGDDGRLCAVALRSDRRGKCGRCVATPELFTTRLFGGALWRSAGR